MKFLPSAIRRVALFASALAVAGFMAGDSASAQGTLSALDTEVRRIADTARPAVVTIIGERDEVVTARNTGAKSKRTRVRVGSGVAVAADAIVTTASVVLGSDRFVIQTSNGLRTRAEVVGADPIFNVAVLRVRRIRLPVLEFADGYPVRAGEWSMAIGTSHRMQVTESVGSIAYRHQEPRVPLLQITNTVYPGYSGGAVLNVRGELIGVVLGNLGGLNAPGRVDPDGRGAMMSFVLPGETVRYVYERLMKDGHVPHGYLGVSTRAEVIESDDGTGSGVPIGARVESTVPGGPAHAVGLEPGDLIVGFERERVEFPEQLARWVAATTPGTEIRLVWVRDDFQHIGIVELDQSPQQIPQWAVRNIRRETPPGGERIDEIEQQIQRLSDELQRLKRN